MLKRPSTRRRSSHAEVQLNLVPMLDALVTMIAFLMYTMAFLSLTMIESPLPLVSSTQTEPAPHQRPLQLTLSIEEQSVHFWSPFDLIAEQTIPNLSSGSPDLTKITATAKKIKQQFPQETKVILVPTGNTSYEWIIQIIDAVKTEGKKKTPLFKEVIFGNLLGDASA